MKASGRAEIAQGMHAKRRHPMLLACLVVALLALVGAQGAQAAAISDEEELIRFGSLGSGAGQLVEPWQIATDPITGYVYVPDNGNNRISEFSPWGEFIKAFGKDVAPGAVNEQQEVRVQAAAGEFVLKFGAGGPGVAETGGLKFNASAGEVEAALNALTNVSASGSVTVTANPGTVDGKTPFIYLISFNGGSLKATNVAQLVAVNGSTPLSGGVPSSSLMATTRADGHAASSGLESCTEESGCNVGLAGGGAGELSNPRGIAVDAEGNVYVREISNHRVQKFDSAGRFVLMFGGEVDKTTKANRCTAASGDECGPGVAGVDPGEFGTPSSHSNIVVCPSGASCPSGTLFVADIERIQRFNLEGEYEASVPVSGKTVHGLSIDPGSGDFYATVGPESGTEENVRKLNSTTGEQIGELNGMGGAAGAVGVDPAGNVFTQSDNRILEFDSEGKSLSPPSCCEPPPSPTVFPFGINGLGINSAGILYVAYYLSSVDSFIRIFGPPPVMFEAPPKVPPSITAQFATSVQRNGATVGAEINPHFFTDARYLVQYGTGKCSEGGCEEEAPAPPGALLTPRVSGSPVKSAGVSLEGLIPGTTYHFRFVVQSGGGSATGKEASFATPELLPQPPCPNDALRAGPAQHLPNCRAYEMVSPVDKNNGDILAIPDLPGYANSLDQSANDGERFTYSSYRSFGDPEAAPFTNQYIASRDATSGWTSEAIDPGEDTNVSHSNGEPPALASPFENHYKAFSEDLCQSWLMVAAEPGLAPGAAPGYNELYRREGCGERSYAALVPIESGTEKFTPVLQGASENGAEAILLAHNLSEAGWRTYYASDGALRPVCVLPSRAVSAGNCSAGTSKAGSPSPAVTQLERQSSLTHAISRDGRKVYWTDFGKEVAAFGKIYLRLNPDQPESARLHGSAAGTGDLIGPAESTGNLTNGSTTIAKVTNAGAFGVGQAITGEGIQAGTTVTAVEAEKERLKISKAATKTKAEVKITGPASATVSGVHTTYGAFAVGQEISAANGGIAAATTIVAVEEVEAGVFKLTLSAPASGSGAAVGLEATSECTEAEKACTVKVSETKTSEASEFLAAGADGGKALFKVGAATDGRMPVGKLYEFNLGGATREVAGEVIGLAGESESLSQIYFVSKEALAGGASAGEPNLYLDEGGTKSFIATLSQIDVGVTIPSDTEVFPIFHAARATPDGGALAFVSTEPLTGYDNTDQGSRLACGVQEGSREGVCDSEVYLYEADGGKLVCISCNPSGARPSGRAVQGIGNSGETLATAAGLAMPTTNFYSPRVLSDDGRRVFFNSFDALLPRDTNGKADVYEWERASGREACEEMGAELYVASSEGCLSLISSGESPQDSEFLDASASGGDAFFSTSASLLPQDPGLIDVYDARVEGGFSQPTSPAACEGEACQSPPEAPNDPTPASSSFEGAGNVVEETATTPKPCAKGKVHRKGKCVSKHRKKANKRAKHKRRAAL